MANQMAGFTTIAIVIRFLGQHEFTLKLIEHRNASNRLYINITIIVIMF